MLPSRSQFSSNEITLELNLGGATRGHKNSLNQESIRIRRGHQNVHGESIRLPQDPKIPPPPQRNKFGSARGLQNSLMKELITKDHQDSFRGSVSRELKRDQKQ
jgi:hypothetical protein